jgi:hypothetical protein
MVKPLTKKIKKITSPVKITGYGGDGEGDPVAGREAGTARLNTG